MFHSLPCAIQMHPNYMCPQRVWKGAWARIAFLILTDLNSHCSYCTGQQSLDEGSDNRNMSKVLEMAQTSVCATGTQRNRARHAHAILTQVYWLHPKQQVSHWFLLPRENPAEIHYPGSHSQGQWLTSHRGGDVQGGEGVHSSVFSGQWE